MGIVDKSYKRLEIIGGKMTKFKQNSKTDFLVTFFVGNKAVSKMLSEVIKNRENPLFYEMLGVPAEVIQSFFREESLTGIDYIIRQRPRANYSITLMGNSCSEHLIQSGDYISFKYDNNRVIKALFIMTSDIHMGYKKFKIAKGVSCFIGRSPINDIAFAFSDFVSREKHICINVDQAGNATIEDLKRTVGVYVNGNLIHSQKLKVFDEIYIMGLSIIYMGDFIAVRNLMIESTLPIMDAFVLKAPIIERIEKEYFVSTPRILKSLDNDEIEIDGPPNPQNMDKTPTILLIGPSITMSIVMLVSLSISIISAINGGNPLTVVTSATMAVGMLLGSLMWPSLLRNYQKRKLIADEKYRKEKYSSYIAEREKLLAGKVERSRRILGEILNPSPEFLCTLFENENNKLRLWERSYEDKDFLSIRMGLGSRPSNIQIRIPKKSFQLYEDEMRELSEKLAQKYGTLSNVPLALDIRNNPVIGVIGKKNKVRTILNEIILNIISLHSYDEVKLVIVTSPKQAYQYEMFKHVPHIWSNDKKIRYFATNSDEVHYIFNVINEILKRREEREYGVVAKPIPHYVLIVTEPSLIEKETLIRYMDDVQNKVGLTTIFAYGDITRLPKSCRTIIQGDDEHTGYYIKNENANKFIPFVLDNIDEMKLARFVDELSDLHIKRDVRTMGLTDSISFLQMYKVGNVSELNIERRWANNNSAKSLATPIGVIAGGEPFYLDIHESYHGCHGLVAGTTGSGKSEFLQAFILSLAINYSPKEVAFVLIDFKGGDMARPFMKKESSSALPHLAATISNLSGNILYRALVSLSAEIKYRQKLFNQSAMNLKVDKLDINSYHKYYKDGKLDIPLPHLVIIIDEFAQLKTQQPDFLDELVNVAQVGRSLGIHLILATQKPSGIVSAQIVSNSRFKVCLKVAERADSQDMLNNKPDAAMIKNPGRLYLQVGYDEIYECVQSGYSGANYIPTPSYIPDDEITVHMTDNTANSIHSAKLDFTENQADKTQLEAVVAEIVALGERKNIVAKPLWLDVLPQKVILDTLSKEAKRLCTATIGLVDYVHTQEQKPLTFDFSETGHIGIYGASGTGKTTFLQTLVYSMVCEYGYTADELNLYAMDFSGRNLGYLNQLPHTGGVVFSDEEEQIDELASILQGIINERKYLFSTNNCGTFIDYHAVEGRKLPAILVLIDNFTPLRDKYMNASDKFVEIISAGKTFGVYFAITGSTVDAIYYKVKEHISTYFALKMNDPGNYLNILNIRPSVVPEDISGRGITVIDKTIVEFQTAVALDTLTESERIVAIEQKYIELAKNWKGYLPIYLNSRGREVDSTEGNTKATSVYEEAKSVYNSPEAICDENSTLVLGSSKSGVLQYGLTLSEDYRLCICTDDVENLSECYRRMLANISKYQARKVVFVDNELGNFKGIAEQFSGCRYIKGENAFGEFLEEWKSDLNGRLEDEEKCLEQLFIVIAEFNEFFDMISDDQAAFMRKVFQYINSPKYGITFICGFNVNGDKNNDRLFMSLIVNAENYLLTSNSYEKAKEKIETLPLLSKIYPNTSYVCLKEKFIEIRW